MAGSSKFWPKAPSQEPPSFLTKETLLSDIQDPPILPLISTVLLVASLCTFTLVYDHITEVSQKEVAWMLHGTPQRGSAWPGVQALSILSFKVQEHKHSMLQNIRCLRNSHKLKRLAREYETRPFYHIDLGVGGNVDCTPDRTIPANIDKKWLTLMLADLSTYSLGYLEPVDLFWSLPVPRQQEKPYHHPAIHLSPSTTISITGNSFYLRP